MELLSLKDFILEARKEETRLHDELEEFATDPNVYFSFNNIKNSIPNRNIHEHTLLGVWCYNLKSAWNHLQIGKLQSLQKVPYSFHENSITLFTVPWNIKLISGKSYNEDDYQRDSKKLFEEYKRKIESSGSTEEEFIKESYSTYFNERIFLLTKKIAFLYDDPSSKWTSIIKDLGYSGVADAYGNGMLSKNEKFINVIIDKSELEFVKKVQL